jgi:hypothetical protein
MTELLNVSGTYIPELQSPTTPATLDQQPLSARKHSIPEQGDASPVAHAVLARVNTRSASDHIRELQTLIKDARNNRGKILKSLEELAIYFATETFTEERHQFSSASVSGKTLSATMSTFYSLIVQCMFLWFHVYHYSDRNR